MKPTGTAILAARLEGPADLRRTLRDRLFSRLAIDPSGCVLWTGGTQGAGYGVISVDGRQHLVHRVAFEIFEGSIPDGLELDHVKALGCTHRNCASLAHLEPVTSPENTRRGGNAAKTHCPQGHPYDAANTYIRPRGDRTCRICQRAANRKRRRERRRRYRQAGESAK